MTTASNENKIASISASSMTSMLSSRPSVSKPHDNSVKREQNPHYSHYNGLIPVTAVRVIVRIAIVAAVSINASTKATALEVTVTETAAACREPVASETAVAHREPMASETATAKAVTSKTPAMASTTAMAATSTAAPCERDCAGRRCGYAEPDSRSCYNHLLAHFSKLLMFHLIWIASA